MRSIATKLILAFIGISMLSVMMVSLVVGWSIRREFSRYLLDRNQAVLVSALARYYAENKSWAGLKIDRLPLGEGRLFNLDLQRRQSFALADKDGLVVVGMGQFGAGDQLTPASLLAGIPIQVNGDRVGTLLLQNLVIQQDQRELAFLRRLNRFLVWVAAGTLLLAVFLAVWLSRTLTRPIRELTTATREISKGRLGVTVPVRSADELGQLAQSFNQMNAELERSLKLRRQMTADIAHELRTPLSLILGHAEAVHDGVLPPSEKSFEIIREEALRLERLIDDLRVLSLADAGELSLEFQPTDVGAWLGEISARYEPLAADKDIRLEIEVGPGLPEVEMDNARMTQVLTNVLDNALRYTPVRGKVTLSAGLSADQLLLAIQDSGPGVSQEDLERIFDRFYRTDPSRQRADGGSGLGLAIAKSLVEKHSGRISARSNAGEGLRIEIRLPLSRRG
jgi:signal transduction histidine kinase